MPFAILIIGAILVVVAFNNTAGQLATELETDIPGYFKWAAAIAAILGLGYIPGLRVPSRWLLGLVLLVILLKNYSQIIAGFQSFLTTTPSTAAAGNASPTQAYAINPTSNAVPSASAIAGTGGTTGTTPTTQVAGATQALTAAQQLAANPLNPNAYTSLISGFGAAL